MQWWLHALFVQAGDGEKTINILLRSGYLLPCYEWCAGTHRHTHKHIRIYIKMSFPKVTRASQPASNAVAAENYDIVDRVGAAAAAAAAEEASRHVSHARPFSSKIPAFSAAMFHARMQHRCACACVQRPFRSAHVGGWLRCRSCSCSRCACGILFKSERVDCIMPRVGVVVVVVVASGNHEISNKMRHEHGCHARTPVEQCPLQPTICAESLCRPDRRHCDMLRRKRRAAALFSQNSDPVLCRLLFAESHCKRACCVRTGNCIAGIAPRFAMTEMRAGVFRLSGHSSRYTHTHVVHLSSSRRRARARTRGRTLERARSAACPHRIIAADFAIKSEYSAGTGGTADGRRGCVLCVHVVYMQKHTPKHKHTHIPLCTALWRAPLRSAVPRPYLEN